MTHGDGGFRPTLRCSATVLGLHAQVGLETLDHPTPAASDSPFFSYTLATLSAPKGSFVRTLLVAVLALMFVQPLLASESPLAGEWVVDLSTDPAKPYTQPMVLQLKADGVVEGSFYASTIEAGRWKDDRGRLCASFRTSDGQGPYHTAVCLAGTIATGQTWAEHRNFLFNWIATRQAQ